MSNMEHVKQFIEDAIEGGYQGVDAKIVDGEIFTFGKRIIEAEILLDPLAWQAVGKTRRWDSFRKCLNCEWAEDDCQCDYKDSKFKIWEKRWHTFIDHLADGDTINDALGKLLDNVS